MLVPLQRSLPGSVAISVAGPGPRESHTEEKDHLPAPALPSKNASEDDTGLISQADDNSQDGIIDDDDDDEPKGTSNPNDPYSNLDGAFSTYLSDQPRPMGAGNQPGGRGEVDDLLF